MLHIQKECVLYIYSPPYAQQIYTLLAQVPLGILFKNENKGLTFCLTCNSMFPMLSTQPHAPQMIPVIVYLVPVLFFIMFCLVVTNLLWLEFDSHRSTCATQHQQQRILSPSLLLIPSRYSMQHTYTSSHLVVLSFYKESLLYLKLTRV